LHIKGKIELRNLFKNQITTNQYTALDSESNIYREKFNLETVLVNKTKAISTRQLGNKIHTKQEYLAINEERDESDKRAKEQPNLQIPTVINGQISRKLAREKFYSNMRDQKRMVRSTYKKIKAMAYSNHKIIIIGDSHVRSLSEMVRKSRRI
jgi:hypothetical protein